jgi:hypothetical protein
MMAQEMSANPGIVDYRSYMNAEEQTILEMQKPVGVALMPLEWFLLLAFFDHLSKKDEQILTSVFSSQEDFDSLMKVAETIHRQAFPPKKSNIEELEESLKVKPKKLITKPDLVL